MNTHESVRDLLSLAAAGALSQQEQLRVEEHARACADCRRELDTWGVFAAGLGQLPQPSAPADLIARTQARILRERGDASASSWNGLTFCSLGIFSWVASIGFWLLVRELSGGMLIVLGTNLVSAVPWFLISFALASVTAAATALLIGNRGDTGRML